MKRKNISQEYKREWSRSETLPLEIQNYKILLVPGFLSDALIGVGDSIPSIRVTRLGEYFDDQMKWLSAQNIEFERVTLPSQDSVENNSKVIAAAIQSSLKPVIIFAHSKGGLDTLEALLKDPTLHPKVHAFIPVQAPFLGSQVADWVRQDLVFDAVSTELLYKLGGTQESLSDLQTSVRKSYMDLNKEKIQTLVRSVKVISYSSYKDPESFRWDTLLKVSRDALLAKHSEHNDGLVAWRNALLPGTRFIVEPDVDHAVPVMHCAFLEFDRVRFLKTLLGLALKPVP